MSSTVPSWLTWLNVFQLCSKTLKVLGHLMVLLVLTLVVASYYAVVGVTYGPMVHAGGLRAAGAVIVIIVFTVMVVMLTWSYIMCVATDPGRVPTGWHPFVDDQQARHELQRMAYADYYFDRRDPRRPRYCKRCQAWKPERSHHCSVMARCVLKMDHYCIWVVNCVGLLNYKFFLLFLVYTLVACCLAVGLLFKSMIAFFSNNLKGPTAPLVFVVVVVDAALALSLAGFLIMHGQLIAANCTTIEMYEKDRIHPWPYNKGWKRNLEEVFGRKLWRALIPRYSQEEKRALLDSCLNMRLLGSPFAHSSASPV